MSGTGEKRRFTLRKGTTHDLDRLVGLEQASFSGDRLSRRSFRSLLASNSAALIVAEAAPRTWAGGGKAPQLDFGFLRVEPEEARALLGYVLVLFREGASTARVYSVAVAADAKGKGVARALLDAAEAEARAREARSLRLEVRADNAAAIKLYEKQGFRESGRVRSYYEDGEAAVRYAKPLLMEPSIPQRHIPYYSQTTDFTCGPASLMMGLAALGHPAPLDRESELNLWREATSIYLIATPGGCEPYGLAVTAARRGFKPSIHVSEKGPYFVEARKGEKRRDIMTEAQRIFRQEAARLSIPVSFKAITMPALQKAFDRGAVALVLVSCHRLHGDRIPHWIVVYAGDSHYIFAHDPWLDRESRKRTKSEGLAIPLPEFERMAAYGRSRLKATVLLER